MNSCAVHYASTVWSTAWKDIFAKLETLEGEAGERQLQTLSDELWRTQCYADGEPRPGSLVRRARSAQ